VLNSLFADSMVDSKPQFQNYKTAAHHEDLSVATTKVQQINQLVTIAGAANIENPTPTPKEPNRNKGHQTVWNTSL